MIDRSSSPKVALASVGLGTIRRGFERYFQELFGVLHGQTNITLYRGAGPCDPGEKMPPYLRLATAGISAIPLRGHAGGPEYKLQCLAFGMGLVPDLMRANFDVIHCIDPPLAKVLSALKRTLRFRTRILFTEGCDTPPQFYPRVDHIHHVAKVPFDEAVRHGVSSSHMTLLPCGMHPERFVSPVSRAELRIKYGIPETTFVALAVSAVQRTFKRVDYIIDEASRIDGDFLLWIDGNPEDPTLPLLAREKLGPRCRITHVPSADLRDLYRMADVLVHASVTEAFGLAVLEAICSGLPAITHNSLHFQWLLEDNFLMADMTAPGNMTMLLRRVMNGRRDEWKARTATMSKAVRRRFDWRNLAPQYLDMYSSVAESRFRKIA